MHLFNVATTLQAMMQRATPPPPPALTAAPAPVVAVETAAELVLAAAATAQDIEIRSHLDLRSLERQDNPEFRGQPTDLVPHRHALLYARKGMRSMRVRSLPPPRPRVCEHTTPVVCVGGQPGHRWWACV